MENLKCQCDKIICQIQGKTLMIKCRHCKRFVVIDLKSLSDQKELKVSFKN